MLSQRPHVIVDEIHAVADDKRGSHLALTLARLDRLVEQNGGRKPQRIGLSATVKPIEDVAAFLSDTAHIVNVGPSPRHGDWRWKCRRDELGPVAVQRNVGRDLRPRGRPHPRRTAPPWCSSTRAACPSAWRTTWASAWEKTRSCRITAASPASCAWTRKRRLKKGELRAVVATASLELGIDIGTVDLVCQIGSPRSIAVALQRIGRAGHWVGALPKGRFFATTRDELVECAALVRAIRRGELDRLEIPRNALDILAQQMVAACAAEDFAEDELFDLVRRAWPYRTLAARRFRRGPASALRGHRHGARPRGAYLHRDAVNRRVRGRRGARLAAITSGGAIPDTAQYLVVAEPEGVTVGTVDEDFAVESMAGDVFLLGTTSWRIRRVEAGPRAGGRCPRRGARIPVLARRGARPHAGAVAARSRGCARRSPRTGAWPGECGLDRRGAEQAVAYVQAGRAALGAMPTDTRVVAERFFDEGGGMQLVIHAPFGARINRAWGLALRKRFCRSFNFELQAAATDNGIVISLGEQHSFPLEIVFEFLRPATVRGRADAGAAARAHVHRALALERLARARHPALQRRPQGAAADPAHARRRPDGRGLPRPGRVPRKPHRRGAHSRPSAGERDDRQLPVRGHGPGRPEGDARSHTATAASAPWRSTRPSRRRSRTRFSTPIRTPISTTRRSRNAAPAPYRCAARCRPTMPMAPARSTPKPSRTVAAEVVAADARRRRIARSPQ